MPPIPKVSVIFFMIPEVSPVITSTSIIIISIYEMVPFFIKG